MSPVKAVTVALVAGVAVLAAVPTARADELSELRTNGQLLQRQLDEINRVNAASAARVGGNTATVSEPGGAFPRSFLLPGTDTSVRIGGSVSESLGYRAGDHSSNDR
jgi:hypothetical protein